MTRNPRPEEQLRGGNEPWERKFEGKSRLYEQKLHMRPDGWKRLHKVPKSNTAQNSPKLMNVERQNQNTLYQLEFDFDTPAEEVRLSGR